MNKKHVIGYTVTALLALTIGAAGASGSSTPTIVAAKPLPAVTVTVPGPVVTVTVTAKPAPAPVAAPVAATIEEGQWTVGTDVQPGRYKVIVPITADMGCYWEINKTGDSTNIVANDNVTGGRPVVTLTSGEDFKTQSCGTWAKI